ncbi:MAG: glycosyltransferase [Magnetococcales bacterium]|nr:glycosyltransferase [Magnetococcales bacterium]
MAARRPRLVVVIPCRDEPEPLATLDSLAACQPPEADIDVLVVVNGSDKDAAPVHQRNQETLEQLRSWSEGRTDRFFDVSVAFHPRLPHRQAGVGLARRIGMDEAARRLLDPPRPSGGIIVALDADCRVADNYFLAITEQFSARPKMVAASIYFEHPLEGLEARHRAGIVGYELFLRAHRLGLRHAGFPHSFHTVGSAMAVRAATYRRVGGMNQRQAGEDFYFLQKVMAHGLFSDLTATTVFPSPRISHRVPFGTGRAMGQWQDSEEETFFIHDPRIYEELKIFFNTVPILFQSGEAIVDDALGALVPFLAGQRFPEALEEMRANTATISSFTKRFFHWFNLFRVMKFAHFAADGYYPRVPATRGIVRLLEWMGQPLPDPQDPEHLLMALRHMDRWIA